MTIAYDGTQYCGWQIQPNGVTIQEVLQNQMEIVLRKAVSIIGSGRTDAGVHARGQTAHFKFDQEIDLRRFLGSLNALLPKDIRVKEILPVPLSFHAQYSAVGKTYHYRLCMAKVQEPFERLYQLHVKEKIDMELFLKAAHFFIGTHDFTSFANEAHTGTAAHDPVRTIKRLDVYPETTGLRMEFEADGFLYKMVRNITGTLLDVARGKIGLQEIPEIFAAKDRTKAGKAAPPHGLFLIKVDYILD